jgi:hypothetical protein
MSPDEHILQHRHLIEQPLILECTGEPERGDGVRGSPGQLVLAVVKADAAAGRRQDAGDEVEDCRLARPVWPD